MIMAKPRPALQVRAPKNLDDFVSGGASDASGQSPAVDVQAPDPKPPAANRQRPAKVRGLVARADGGARMRITVYLDPDVGMKLRRHCFEHGLEVSDVAADAITKLVNKL